MASRSTIPTVLEGASPAEGVPETLRSAGIWWLTATALFSLLVYYMVGVDQGALSLLGNDMHVHELLHDGRHLLGFPCH